MPVTPTPPQITFTQADSGTNNVLAADPDIIKLDIQTLPIDLISNILLQDIGGIELSMVVRHDRVSGKVVSDSIVSNLSLINSTFSASSMSTRYSPKLWRVGLSLEDYLVTSEPSIIVDETSITIATNSLPEGYAIDMNLGSLEVVSAYG